MRRRQLLIIFLLGIVVVPASCMDESFVIVEQVDPQSMIHYSTIESFQEISSSSDRYIIYFKKGDTIPLHITLNNDYVETRNKSIDIVAKRTIYFMIQDLERSMESTAYHITRNSRIYVSFDAVRWAPVHDGDALKELSGIEREDVSFGFRVTDREGVTSQLVIDSY
ncbi:MAG: hypothetical protein ACOCWH_03425 [Spirochaetota bacterium]